MAPDQLLEQKQAEKKEVKGYFETTGFDRWNRIYSDSDDMNKVQRNIRIGHQKTVDEVLAWIKESGEVSQASFCDAGCGVGSLSLPLAATSPLLVRKMPALRHMSWRTSCARVETSSRSAASMTWSLGSSAVG